MYRAAQLLLRWKVKQQPVLGCAIDDKRARVYAITCHTGTDEEYIYIYI
jgi:hypothetical protein